MERLEALESWVNERLAALGHEPVSPPERPDAAVVGLDGTTRAEDAARWAARVAEQVHLVTVLPSPSTSRPRAGSPRARSRDASGLRDLARWSVQRLERELDAGSLEVHEIEGSTVSTLQGTPGRWDAGLLAVGAGEETRNPSTPFGSVSSRLLHEATVSTLVARARPGTAPITGAVGTDGASRLAAGWATALAAWLERPLQLLHAGRADGFEAEGPGARAREIEWPPRFGIERALSGEDGGLIVVGHLAASAGLGSTALQLSRTAPSSVLVARPGRSGDR